MPEPGEFSRHDDSIESASHLGFTIDLGAIAKGWSADRGLQAMRAAWPDMPGGLVDLGGDLALWGATPDDAPWRVAVADPHKRGQTLTTLSVIAGGVVTSGRTDADSAPVEACTIRSSPPELGQEWLRWGRLRRRDLADWALNLVVWIRNGVVVATSETEQGKDAVFPAYREYSRNHGRRIATCRSHRSRLAISEPGH